MRLIYNQFNHIKLLERNNKNSSNQEYGRKKMSCGVSFQIKRFCHKMNSFILHMFIFVNNLVLIDQFENQTLNTEHMEKFKPRGSA